MDVKISFEQMNTGHGNGKGQRAVEKGKSQTVWFIYQGEELRLPYRASGKDSRKTVKESYVVTFVPGCRIEDVLEKAGVTVRRPEEWLRDILI